MEIKIQRGKGGVMVRSKEERLLAHQAAGQALDILLGEARISSPDELYKELVRVAQRERVAFEIFDFDQEDPASWKMYISSSGEVRFYSANLLQRLLVGEEEITINTLTFF
jgi:hypothetical protein